MGARWNDDITQAGIVQAEADLVRLEWLDFVFGDVDGHLHPWSVNLLPALNSPDVAWADLESVWRELFGKYMRIR